MIVLGCARGGTIEVPCLVSKTPQVVGCPSPPPLVLTTLVSQPHRSTLHWVGVLHHLQRRPDALLEPSPAHSPSLGNSDRDALLPRPSLRGRCSSRRYCASNLAQAGSSLKGQTSALSQSSKHARRDRGREQSKHRAARARCQIETGSASASEPRGGRRGGRRRGHRARK